jgi:copper chaperone
MTVFINQLNERKPVMPRKRFTAVLVFALMSVFGAITALAETREITIKVEGMTCGGCAASLTKALKDTPGVLDARASYEKGEAWIKYDDQKITVAKLREVINSTGFKAVEEKKDKNKSAARSSKSRAGKQG